MGNCISKRSAKREQLASAEAKYVTAATALASREEELANTRKDFEDCKEHADITANQVRELETRLEDTTVELDKAQSKAQQLEGTIAELEKDRDALTDELSTVKSDTVNQVHELETPLRDHAIERDKAQSKAEQLEEAITELEKDKNALTNELCAVKSDTAVQLHTAQQTADKELSAARACAAKELALAQAAVASSTKELATMHKQLECTSASRDDATENLQNLRLKHRKLVAENKTLDDLVQSTKEKLDAREEEVSKLLSVGLRLEKVISDLRQDHNDLQSKYRLLKADSEQRYQNMSNTGTGGRSSIGNEFSSPVKFSRSGKDVRIEVSEWNCETRIDVREWYFDRRAQTDKRTQKVRMAASERWI